METVIEDISPTYGKVKYRLAFQIDHNTFLSPRRKEMCLNYIDKYFRTFIKQAVKEWHYAYYLPFYLDNKDWEPEGTKYGEDTKYQKRKLPIVYSVNELDMFLKLFPECKV